MSERNPSQVTVTALDLKVRTFQTVTTGVLLTITRSRCQLLVFEHRHPSVCCLRLPMAVSEHHTARRSPAHSILEQIYPRTMVS